eukprot:7449528-Heterocapsa_arctica.AAC.1
MEGRTSANIRVKWVPSHKDEQGVRDGIISQEHMKGNREADKLATRGVNMHLVPEARVKEVHAQDELVRDLLTMKLEVMKG